MTDTRKRKVTDYTPDPVNANAGTERGVRMLEDSVASVGLGRSIVVDKNGVIVAGNKTLQAAVDAGLLDVVEVETKGDKLVVVRRTDFDATDADPNNPARRYAYLDNRTGEVSLDWDAEQILADINAGFDFDGLFREDELDDVMQAANRELEALLALEQGVSSPRDLGDKKMQIKPVLYVDEVAVFERAISATGLPNRGEALIAICQHYIDVYTANNNDSG